MKPRLFWTMLLAFALVIVLGVCGMFGFFGLAFAGVWQPGGVRDTLDEPHQAYADLLADYYVAHDNSWSGIDRRLDGAPVLGSAGFLGYTLTDADGRVVASNDRALPVGQVVDQRRLARGTPVQARGARIGTLLTRQGITAGQRLDNTSGPPSFVWPVLRSFLLAGLGLVLALLTMAVVFAQRLSHPLRNLTVAAQALAAGRLDVQVEGATVRELDELAHAFNAMSSALAQADRHRRQMTADVAHELRTPLTIIKGRLEGLQDGVYEATPDQIARLLDETALLERLIEDLRLLALAEAGQLPLYQEMLDPRDLLEGAAATFAAPAAAQRVALQVQAGDDLPPIDVDPQRMAQVLANLVANALRHTPAEGTITLEAAAGDGGWRMEDGGWEVRSPSSILHPPSSIDSSGVDCGSSVVFRVRDTGQGIAPEDLPHIFDRFWRADRSRARGSGGTGLGLAIARQIVAAHGGAIWAESEEGRGTTISIAMPVANNQQ